MMHLLAGSLVETVVSAVGSVVGVEEIGGGVLGCWHKSVNGVVNNFPLGVTEGGSLGEDGGATPVDGHHVGARVEDEEISGVVEDLHPDFWHYGGLSEHVSVDVGSSVQKTVVDSSRLVLVHVEELVGLEVEGSEVEAGSVDPGIWSGGEGGGSASILSAIPEWDIVWLLGLVPDSGQVCGGEVGVVLGEGGWLGPWAESKGPGT
jgi:hypothetical protein